MKAPAIAFICLRLITRHSSILARVSARVPTMRITTRGAMNAIF